MNAVVNRLLATKKTSQEAFFTTTSLRNGGYSHHRK